jgi:hypothetical protein
MMVFRILAVVAVVALAFSAAPAAKKPATPVEHHR